MPAAPADLEAWAGARRAEGRSIVMTNGVYDLLHDGHLRSLVAAAQEVEKLLLVLNRANSKVKLDISEVERTLQVSADDDIIVYLNRHEVMSVPSDCNWWMTTQTYNRGISFIVLVGRRQFRRQLPALPVDACVEEGRRIASAAAWLPAIPWEERLAEPLEQAHLRRAVRHRPHRVDDVFRRQVVPPCDHGRTGVAAAERAALGQQPRAGRPVDGAIDAPTPP